MSERVGTMVQHNLPASTDLFVGRKHEAAQLMGLLGDPACRLVTIAGPGGVGKTRLALECARAVTADAATRFADGVYLVTLGEHAPTAELPDQLADALAHGLGLHLATATPPLDQLHQYLRTRALLLVLDNAEQISGTAPTLAALLNDAPGLVILATSREPLHLRGEWCILLAGLPFPTVPTLKPAPNRVDLSTTELEAFDAVQLFVHTARMAAPGFTLTAANASAVTQICRLLEGLPLGIELATSWLRTLSCTELATLLSQDLDILAVATLDRAERQRNLRALFEASWQLLIPAEQQALQRLAIFRGSFTRTAATDVANVTLPQLAALIDKSLLRRETSDSATEQGRYRMPELVRRYAAEQLERAGEFQTFAQRHATFYAELLATQVPYLRGTGQRAALAVLQSEMPQLQAAWQTAVSHADYVTLSRAADGLFHCYDMHSWFHEGAAAFGAAVTALEPHGTHPAATQVWAHALARYGWFTFHIGQQREAQATLQRSLDVLRELGAWAEMLFPLNYLGAVSAYLGEYTATEALCREALAIAQTLSDRYDQAIACNILGQAAYDQGQYTVAQSWSQQSLALEQQLGNRWSMAYSLTNLGKVAYITGAYAEARRMFEESLRIRQGLEDARGVAHSFMRLGETAVALGAIDEANEQYSQSLAMFRAIGNRWGEAAAQINRMHLALAQGDFGTALELMHEALQIALDLESLPQVVTLLATVGPLIRQSGDATWAAALDQLLAAAPTTLLDYQSDAYRLLAWLKRNQTRTFAARPAPALPAANSASARRPTQAGNPAGLTAREIDVLRLVARGLTDAEVADKLVVSRRTVSTHLSAIYGKLQVNSRSAATRFAIEHGLG